MAPEASDANTELLAAIVEGQKQQQLRMDQQTSQMTDLSKILAMMLEKLQK
jgi:hypothetical protein